jgi:hypothetical protein
VNVFGGFSDADLDKAIEMIQIGVKQERRSGSVGPRADLLIVTAMKAR